MTEDAFTKPRVIIFPGIPDKTGGYRTLNNKPLAHRTAFYCKVIKGDENMGEVFTPEEIDYIIKDYVVNKLNKELVSKSLRDIIVHINNS
jgi:hypothetical protein